MALIPRPLLFIHGNDPESRTRARQHVSKVVRSREREGRFNPRHVRQILPSQRTCKGSIQRTRKPCSGLDDDMDSSHASLPPRSPLNKCNTTRTRERTNIHARVSKQLSATPSDPFGTLPVKLSPTATELLHHYSTVMPSVEFGVVGNAPLVPSRDLAFRSAMETPCSLHTIIAIAAVQKANLYKYQYPVLVSHHLSQSLRLLREGINQLNAKNWRSFVQPLFELVACDELRGEYQSLKIHLNALRRLLQQFGGLRGVTGLPRLQLLTCYVLHGAGVSYFSRIQSPETSKDDESHENESQWSGSGVHKPLRLLSAAQVIDVQDHVEEFCGCLTEASMLSATKGPMIGLVRFYFNSSTSLAKSLCTLSVESDDQSCLGQKGFHHVATLMLVVQELIEIINSQDCLALELTLEKLHLIYQPNMRLFKFFVMQGGTSIGFRGAERNWKVVRLMQVYKLLPTNWRRRTGRILLDFLQGPLCLHSIQDTESPTATDTWTSAGLLEVVVSGLINECDRIPWRTGKPPRSIVTNLPSEVGRNTPVEADLSAIYFG